MIYVKTQAGQQALKERHGALTPRQRPAFILFDGKRTAQQVLEATAAMGVTAQDVQSMVEQGLLEPLGAPAPAGSASTADAAADSVSPNGFKSSGDRYQDAYRIATELTSGLGLRGLPLTLAVEAAGGYRELQALAPRIRAAVGEAKFARLEQALNG